MLYIFYILKTYLDPNKTWSVANERKERRERGNQDRREERDEQDNQYICFDTRYNLKNI